MASSQFLMATMSYSSASIQGVVALVLGVVAFLAARSRHQALGQEEIYRYPPFVGYLMGGCGVFFLCIPLFPGRGDVPIPLWWAFFGSAAACAFGAAVYFFRYRVLIDDSVLRFGTAALQTIPLADVVDTDITAGRNAQLFVYLRSGRRLEFSSMLGDFGSLAATIADRCAGPPPGTGVSIQKLTDQRRRAALNRRVSWMLATGLLMCVVAALAAWQYG
jgi:hypothetical protein